MRLFMVAGEHSGDALGGKLMAALKRTWQRPRALSRRRRRAHGEGGPRLAVPARGGGGDGPARDPRPIAASIMRRVYAHRRRGRRRRTRRRRHHRQPGVHASDRQAHPPRAVRTSPSSTTSRRACGRGGRAGRARCAPTSITCWRCCRSSRRRTSGSAGRRCTYVGHPLIERLDVDARARPAAAGRRLAARPARPCSSCCPAAEPRRSRG